MLPRDVDAKPGPSIRNLSPNINKILPRYTNNVDKLKSKLEKPPELDEMTHLLKEKEASFFKAMNILKKAAKERKFTLSPIVAKYTPSSHEVHLTKLFSCNREIDHFFVKPIRAYNGVFYWYELFIPIPIDISNLEDARSLLKEHWELIQECIPLRMRQQLIYDFKPLATIDRVYGWNGAWMAYSAMIKEAGDFWSPPLTNCPYNGIQPYVCFSDGEIVILTNDETELCRKKVNHAKEEIYNRVKANKNIIFESRTSIEIAPEWIIAAVDHSNPNLRPDLRKTSHDRRKDRGC
jgi:hypothetical protein